MRQLLIIELPPPPPHQQQRSSSFLFYLFVLFCSFVSQHSHRLNKCFKIKILFYFILANNSCECENCKVTPLFVCMLDR